MTTALLLAIAGGAMVAAGVTTIVLTSKARRRQVARDNPASGNSLLVEMLLASLDPALRDFLRDSADPQIKGKSSNSATIERIARVALPTTRSNPAPAEISLEAVAVSIGLVETRLDELIASSNRGSVTRDNVVWVVMGVLGAILALIGSMLAIATGAVKLIGAG